MTNPLITDREIQSHILLNMKSGRTKNTKLIQKILIRLRIAEETILELYDPAHGKDCPGVEYFEKVKDK